MFTFLGRLTTRHPWLCCLAWLVMGGSLWLVAPRWDARAQDDDIRFLPDRCPSVRGYRLLAQAFPQDVFASRVIFAVERDQKPLSQRDFAVVDRLVRELEQLRHEEPELQIGKITSYEDAVIGSRLISADRQCTLVQASLGTPFLATQTRTTVDRAEARLRQCFAGAGDGLRLMVTGPAGIGRDLTQASAEGLEGTTLATVVLVVVVLLLVYRAPLLALVPLGTIALSVWVALQLLALFTLLPGVHLVNVSRVFAVVILYGAGTDYCLFLISRYQENLRDGMALPLALSRSVRGVGGALAASAGTVICGLGLMGFAEFAKVRCAGPAIALSLAVALAASLTLAPALLQLLGRAVFWPARLQVSPVPQSSGTTADALWERISRGVVARPLLVWSAASLVLVPLVIIGLRVSPHYRPTGELSPQTSSVRGVATIQRHFTAGEIGPLTVLLASPTDWSTPAGRALIGHLSRGFGHLPNVAEVRSLTQPLGKPLPLQAPPLNRNGVLGGLLRSFQRGIDGALAQAARAARQFYVATVQAEDADSGTRYVTRLDVIFQSDPFDPASKQTVEEIQQWLNEQLPAESASLGSVQAECYGVTVNGIDLTEITEADRARVNSLVVGGIFVILVVLVRRAWLAAYLLGTVLFSYYATLGATALAGWLWSGRPLDLVDWRVPFFLFTILVAVGEDYNIFLVTRMLKERRRHGAHEGIRRALASTGGTITSCGLIMAGTFATLMISGLGTLIQIGFALAFGVLLDTFLVRPFLVPTLALLYWRQHSRRRTVRTLPYRRTAPPLRRAA